MQVKVDVLLIIFDSIRDVLPEIYFGVFIGISNCELNADIFNIGIDFSILVHLRFIIDNYCSNDNIHENIYFFPQRKF